MVHRGIPAVGWTRDDVEARTEAQRPEEAPGTGQELGMVGLEKSQGSKGDIRRKEMEPDGYELG